MNKIEVLKVRKNLEKYYNVIHYNNNLNEEIIIMDNAEDENILCERKFDKDNVFVLNHCTLIRSGNEIIHFENNNSEIKYEITKLEDKIDKLVATVEVNKNDLCNIDDVDNIIYYAETGHIAINFNDDNTLWIDKDNDIYM